LLVSLAQALDFGVTAGLLEAGLLGQGLQGRGGTFGGARRGCRRRGVGMAQHHAATEQPG